MSVLRGNEICEERYLGEIVIEPFAQECVSNSSYDVTLGEYYWRQSKKPSPRHVLNPYSDDLEDSVWEGPFKGETLDELEIKSMNNIDKEDRVIMLEPGETILGHTHEFIGARTRYATEISATSALGRNDITICKCASWGGIGFTNRWTLEITNSSRYRIPLVVNRKVGQIVFFRCSTLSSEESDSYSKSYQSQEMTDVVNSKSRTAMFNQLVECWSPKDMLPKMHKYKTIVYK